MIDEQTQDEDCQQIEKGQINDRQELYDILLGFADLEYHITQFCRITILHQSQNFRNCHQFG